MVRTYMPSNVNACRLHGLLVTRTLRLAVIFKALTVLNRTTCLGVSNGGSLKVWCISWRLTALWDNPVQHSLEEGRPPYITIQYKTTQCHDRHARRPYVVLVVPIILILVLFFGALASVGAQSMHMVSNFDDG